MDDSAVLPLRFVGACQLMMVLYDFVNAILLFNLLSSLPNVEPFGPVFEGMNWDITGVIATFIILLTCFGKINSKKLIAYIVLMAIQLVTCIARLIWFSVVDISSLEDSFHKLFPLWNRLAYFALSSGAMIIGLVEAHRIKKALKSAENFEHFETLTE